MTAATDKLEASKKLARDYIDQIFNQHFPPAAHRFQNSARVLTREARGTGSGGPACRQPAHLLIT